MNGERTKKLIRDLDKRSAMYRKFKCKKKKLFIIIVFQEAGEIFKKSRYTNRDWRGRR